jgi:hypothetical protein
MAMLTPPYFARKTLHENLNLTPDNTDSTDLHGSKGFNKTIFESVLSVFIRGEICLCKPLFTCPE